MATYTVELTDAEDKSLRYEIKKNGREPQEWITEHVKSVCGRGAKEIIDRELAKVLDDGGTLSGTRDEIILAADVG